jgi:hypothetical protein
MFSANFYSENVNFVLQNPKKFLFSPIDNSLVYLVQVRLRTSTYTKCQVVKLWAIFSTNNAYFALQNQKNSFTLIDFSLAH